MSAETLRAARRRIRHDVEFGQAHGDDGFLLAVADLLDAEAEAVDFQRSADPAYVMRDNDEALAVARAYLGESL